MINYKLCIIAQADTHIGAHAEVALWLCPH
jgi:hypothetical protein